MANIDPLRITEPKRQDKTPVFAGGAGQIDTTVPRGRLALLDSGELQRAVTAREQTKSEFLNMLSVGAQVYDDNEKRKKKAEQLKIEGEYRRWEINKQEEFQSVHTAEGKLGVYNSYKVGVDKLNARVKGMGWDTLDDKTWSQGLAIGARKTGADMGTKYNHAHFTETFTDLKIKLAENEKDFANKGNIDPLTHRDVGIKTIEDMFAIGGITKDQMIGKTRAYEHSIALKRGSLLATLWARKKRDDPANMPTREQLIANLQSQIGLQITHDLIEPLNKAFVESFLDEIKYGNKMASYKEQVQALEWREDRLRIDKRVKDAIIDGSANGKTFKDAVDEYSLMGDTDKILEIQGLRIAWENNQTPNRKILDYYTNPQGIGFQRFIAKGTKEKPNPFMEGLILNVEKAMNFIKEVPADDEFGHNDHATLLAVERTLHTHNDKVKNNEVNQQNIFQYANQYLLEYIDKDGTEAIQARKRLQNFLGLDDRAAKKLELGGNQLTDYEWGDLLYKRSRRYKAILEAIETDIDTEIQRDRDGVGLYSNKGFKQSTERWNSQHMVDVQKRLAEMMGEKPVDLVSSSVSDTSNTLTQLTNTNTQNNFPTKSQKSTISHAKQVAKTNKTSVSAIQQDITSGNASGNSPTNVINNAGSNIATAKSKKQPTPNNLDLTLNDFSEDEEPEITPHTVADQQSIFKEKTDQKIKMFTDAYNWVGEKSEQYNEWNKEMWKIGVEAFTSKFEEQVSEPFSDLLYGRTLENLGEQFGFTGFELSFRDQWLKDEIEEDTDLKEFIIYAKKKYSNDKDKVPLTKDKVPPTKDAGTYAKSDTPAYGFKPQLHDTLQMVSKAKFMQSVNENVEKDMEIATNTMAQRLKSAITPKFNIGEDFDPSNIGYNPTQQSVAPTTTQQPKYGTKLGVNIDKVLERSTPAKKPAEMVDTGKEQVFDPNILPQIVRPIVEEVTKSITMSLAPESLTPESIELPDRFEALDPTGKDKETLGLEWLENWVAEKKRERARLAPLKEAKDMGKVQHEADTKDFATEQNRKRWTLLYNKNIKNKGANLELTDGYSTQGSPLSAKEQTEFKRLTKYLQDRGMIPEEQKLISETLMKEVAQLDKTTKKNMGKKLWSEMTRNERQGYYSLYAGGAKVSKEEYEEHLASVIDRYIEQTRGKKE